MINFFRRRISAKIILGYMVTIILMATFSFFALQNQSQTSFAANKFTQNLEVEKTLAQNIVTHLALARLYTNKYTQNPIQDNLDQFEIQFTELETMLDQAISLVTDADRKEKLYQIRTDIIAYGSIFNQMTLLTQKNQQIELQVLNARDVVVENKITALRVYLNAQNDPALFLLYSNAQVAYQSLRLNVMQYIAKDDEYFGVLANRSYQDVELAFSRLQTTLKDPIQLQNSNAGFQAIQEYYAGFKSIQQNQSQLRNLFIEGLDILEPRISDAVTQMAISIGQEFEFHTLESQKTVLQMRYYTLGATLLLVLLSLAGGIFFSYNITRPLQQVMLASQQIANIDLALLSTQMSSLSQGDLHLQLDITTRPLKVTREDEAGQMALAFNEIIFRLQDTRLAFEQMTAYLNEMASAARDVAQGNLNTSVLVRTEQDVLAKAIVNMVKNLRATQSQVLTQLSRLSTLHEVDSMITTSQNLPATLEYLLNQAIIRLEIDAAEILLLDRQTQLLNTAVRAGFPQADKLPLPEQLIQDMAFLAINQKKRQEINNLDPINAAGYDAFRASIAIPLLVQGEPNGAMMIFSRSPLAPDSDWYSYLETLAGQAAIAIDNHELVRGLETRVVQRTIELQRSQLYFQSLFDHSPVAIVVVDLDGKISSWNPAAEKLFGYNPEEVTGQFLDEIVAPGEFHTQAMNYSKLSEREFIHFFTHRVRKDGSSIAVDIYGGPMIVEGQFLGSLAIYHDISELEKARQTAEDATRTKSEFLANMSHEIRTPINGVMGMTSLLLSTPLTHMQRDYVETIRISSESLLTIVNDILDFSKIEAGRMDLDIQPFNLRQCVESALDLVAHQAASKQLELAYLMFQEVPEYVFGDETRIRQILANLLSNAVKFTENGEVIVTIQRIEEQNSTGEIAGNCRLQVSVRDTGLGIPMDRLDRLFRSFSQLDTSTTRKYGGTGLGLSISKKLIEMMNGHIWVESEGIPGKGSVFHFSIQLYEAPNQPKLDRSAILSAMVNKRLFIVDDNPTNRQVLIHMFQNWKMTPIAFSSGKDILAAIDSGITGDLAILDIQMPDMDGIMLAQEIRKRLNPARLPLIFLSSLGHKETTPDGVEPAAFLHKPIKSSQLFDTLLTLFSEHPIHIEPLPAEDLFDPTMGERHPLRILIAEDHVVNQKVALLTLERLGYRADIVANGLEVLQSFARQDYDLVLMDVQMPEMDGIEATAHLRHTLPADRQPWIVALTANALSGDRERYLNAGMDSYLSKPIHINQLVKLLEISISGTTRKEKLLENHELAAAGTPPEPEAEIHIEPKDEEFSSSQWDDLTQSPPIDLAVLQEYFPNFEQKIHLLIEVVQLYIDDTPRRLDKIKAAILEQDIDNTHNLAHALKGASLTFGAVILSNLAKDLETLCRTRQLDGACELFNKIETEYQRVEFSLLDLIGA